MKVLVLGSGVIGVVGRLLPGARRPRGRPSSTASPAPALETSFANAGEVSPGYSAPWAGPGVPLKAIKWLLMHHRPLVIRPQLDLAMWRWGLAMLRNCTAGALRDQQGAAWCGWPSTAATACAALRAETGIAYDERTQGTLQLFRTQKQLDGSGRRHRGPEAVRRAFEVLDRDGCVAARAGAGAGARQVRRRPAPAGRRDRRLLQVHAAAGRAGGARWA